MKENELELSNIEKGIKTTEDVWKKYVAHIENLMASTKLNEQDALKIQGMIRVLRNHWQDFKVVWSLDCPNSGGLIRNHEINLNQRYVDKQQSLNCFGQKLTQLHHAVQDYVYPCWFDRLYQFIKTSLLKIHNCLFAGPRHISSEKVFIPVTHFGYVAMMPSYTPKKHNYSICLEKLRHNTHLLKEDLASMENGKQASRLR